MSNSAVSKLRNAFIGAVMYSETVNPYQKIGLGVVGFIQPVNIPTPIDFLFYVGLIGSGTKQAYADIKKRFNGQLKIEKFELTQTALAALNTKSPSHTLEL